MTTRVRKPLQRAAWTTSARGAGDTGALELRTDKEVFERELPHIALNHGRKSQEVLRNQGDGRPADGNTRAGEDQVPGFESRSSRSPTFDSDDSR